MTGRQREMEARELLGHITDNVIHHAIVEVQIGRIIARRLLLPEITDCSITAKVDRIQVLENFPRIERLSGWKETRRCELN